VQAAGGRVVDHVVGAGDALRVLWVQVETWTDAGKCRRELDIVNNEAGMGSAKSTARAPDTRAEQRRRKGTGAVRRARAVSKAMW